MTVFKENGDHGIKIIRDDGHLLNLCTTDIWFHESQFGHFLNTNS